MVRFFNRWWFAIALVAITLASDTKFRLKGSATAAGGSADTLILLEVGLYLLVAAYLLGWRVGRLRIGRWPTPYVAFAVYTALVVLSVSYAVYTDYAVIRAVQSVILLALIGVAIAERDVAHFHRAAHLFMAATAVMVVIGLVLPSERGPLQLDRFNWLAVHPVVVGLYCAIAVVLGVMYCVSSGAPDAQLGAPRWAYAGYTVFVAAALIQTHTRGAAAGALVAVVVGLWVGTSAHRRVEYLLGLLVVSTVLLLSAGGLFLEFAQRGETNADLVTLNNRTSLWELAFEAFNEQPVFGYGVGSTRGMFVEATGLGGGHNAAVNVMVDLGAAGLLAWGAVLLTTLYWFAVSRRTAALRRDRAIGFAVLTALAVDSLFFEGLGGPTNVAAFWLALLVGWASVLQQRSWLTPPTAAAPGPPALRRGPVYAGTDVDLNARLSRVTAGREAGRNTTP